MKPALRRLCGSPAFDPVTYVVVSTTLALVALLATWPQARQATRIDPMVALRSE